MLTFGLYSVADVFVRVLTPRMVHVEDLWNVPSFCELTFDDDDPQLDVIGPGSRVRVFFTPGGGERFEVMRGPLVEEEARSPLGERTVTFEDDLGVLRNLGWQSPTSPIPTSAPAATQPSEYRRYTGPTETVVRSAIGELSTRLGLGLVAGVSSGVGSAQRVEFRMHSLLEKLQPLLEQDRLTLTITAGVVDVRLGPLFPRVLTPETQVLGDYSWRRTAPEATRGVAGGGGQDLDRIFQRLVNTTAEAEWGFIREVFRDARMAGDETDLTPDLKETLTEGAARVVFKAELNETSWFRYGTYRVGDRVHLKVPGLELVDVIRQVVITDSAEDGLVVTPVIGEFEDTETSRLGRQVRALAAGQGRQ